ncbi:MAG: methyltransferase domain-containing protein [Cryomorphaceae bacterium]|nr:methyltransferase domain-containing protein [Cryomorphaceae bacterium]
MREFWEQRYREDTYAYGETPNLFLQQEIQKLAPQSILFPAEGEGRNAVFAAQLGWNVTAFDISEAGRNKAFQLAHRFNVDIEYKVGSLEDLELPTERFDAMALIFAHFPASVKSNMHKELSKLLRPGATIIFEAFSKANLAYVEKNPSIGGPKDIDALFSLEEIAADFIQYEHIVLEEREVLLQEGIYHNGLGKVVRFIGKKK